MAEFIYLDQVLILGLLAVLFIEGQDKFEGASSCHIKISKKSGWR